MDDDENPIDRALGIGPIEPMRFSSAVSDIVSRASNDSATEDFTYARANIREVVQNGNDAVIELAKLANQSQNPRAYEVLAKLMDTLVAANRELLELQQKIREVEKADVPRNGDAKIITNNLFVGSTAELQKALKELNPDGNHEP